MVSSNSALVVCLIEVLNRAGIKNNSSTKYINTNKRFWADHQEWNATGSIGGNGGGEKGHGKAKIGDP